MPRSLYTTRRSINPFAASVALAAVGIAWAPLTAHAQARLLFTGGAGTPVTITLTTPVTYTVTASTFNPPFAFNLVGAGNLFNITFTTVAGTMGYRIKGESAHGLNGANRGYPFSNDIQPDDIYVFNTLSTVNTGDVVTLLPGSLTTIDPVTAAAPQGGTFATFLVDNNAARISGFDISGASAPEANTLALLVPAAGLILCRRLRS